LLGIAESLENGGEAVERKGRIMFSGVNAVGESRHAWQFNLN
jgi:hypothetical protein